MKANKNGLVKAMARERVKQKVSISLAVVVILLTIIWFLNIFFMIIIVTGRVVLNIYIDLHYLFGGCCAAIWLGI